MKLKKFLAYLLTLMLLLSCASLPVLADGAPWTSGMKPTSTQIFYTATAKVEPSGMSTYDSESSVYDSNSQKGIMVFKEDVTAIAENAFKENANLTGIILPDTVTSINQKAFYQCTALASVSMPKVTSIGMTAFFKCSNLTSVSMPKVTDIGGSAFHSCSNLASVSMLKVTSIGNYAFMNCSSLGSVFIPEAINVSNSAFSGCSSLASVSMPKATSIGNYTFKNCSALKSVSMPKVTSVGEGAFGFLESSSVLTSVYMPEATSVGAYAFNGCTELKSVYMPKITEIPEDLFYNCNTLTYVYASTGASDSLSSTYSLYPLTFATAENGTVSLADADFAAVSGSQIYAVSGKTVSVSAAPADGYMPQSLTADYNDGTQDQSLAVTNGSFLMPAFATTVNASFSAIETSGEDFSLDLEASTEDIPASKDIDQYYIKVSDKQINYTCRIEYTIVSQDIKVLVPDSKIWDPAQLQWVENETKSGKAILVDGSSITIQLTNYSPRAYICELSFVADSEMKDRAAEPTIVNNKCRLEAVANDVETLTTDSRYFDGDTIKTDELPTATITAEVAIADISSFDGASAGTADFGTFTIKCTPITEE